ncbi:hypothetical protein niasHT_008542 [Heterodera trifolii]|uniref:Secreted protein n=1 Tax=Heterodera trifolii TaxID=157864 RepID=A0ABD2M9W2_9BILA
MNFCSSFAFLVVLMVLIGEASGGCCTSKSRIRAENERRTKSDGTMRYGQNNGSFEALSYGVIKVPQKNLDQWTPTRAGVFGLGDF